VRDELRGRLRVVLASRIALMDAEQARLEEEIGALTGRIDSSAAEIETLETSQHSLTERGYELDHQGQEAQNRASEAAVELERATARERGNAERIASWRRGSRLPAPSWSRRRRNWPASPKSANSSALFLNRQRVRQRRSPAGGIAPAGSAYRGGRRLQRRAPVGTGRRHAMHVLTQAGNARNHRRRRKRAWRAGTRVWPLEAEMGQARNELENLGVQSGRSVCASSPLPTR